MKLLYTAFVFILTTGLSLAQTGRITGTLTDSASRKPTAYTTVALLGADGKLLIGVATTDYWKSTSHTCKTNRLIPSTFLR